MFEQQVDQYMRLIGTRHAAQLANLLPGVLPFMKHHQDRVALEVHRFRGYLIAGPSDNVAPVLGILHSLATELPEARASIALELGDILYEYRALGPSFPNSSHVEAILGVIGQPPTPHDEQLRRIARSIVTLHTAGVVVAGAGFSYDTMPITGELKPLLVQLLRMLNQPDPMKLIETSIEDVWGLARANREIFKLLFAGYCAGRFPAHQHTTVCRMLHEGGLSHVISFNWDDLFEKAHLQAFGAPVPKVARDGVMSPAPALWKLHGDVEDPDAADWVFPYDPGRLFDSLMESLERTAQSAPPAFALIVGYSEHEQTVRERLVDWLTANVPLVLRVRPNWPGDNEGGFPESAARFFQRLTIYLEMESSRGIHAA